MLKYLSFTIVVLSLAMSCSKDGGSEPKSNTLIRMLNAVYDDTAGLDVYVNGTKVTSKTTALMSSGYVNGLTSGDRVPVAVHYTGDPVARIQSLLRMYDGGNFTGYAFPPAEKFSVTFSDDPRQAAPGQARLKIVNGVSDGGYLALAYTDEPSTILGPNNYTTASNYADIHAGTYAFSILKPSDPMFEIAFDSVRLDVGSAYTLMLTGTINDADGWSFIARLYDDNGNGNTYRDLIVALDRGKFQVVHCVPGMPAMSVTIDNAAMSRVNNLLFGSQSPYIDLTTGGHTATVESNKTQIIIDAPFTVGKRVRSTMFITGSTVPANIAPLVLTDIKKPLSIVEASIRIVNLSPDAPALDGYFVNTTGDQKIPECQDISFRETSLSSTFGGQFFSLYPSTVSVVFKKAGTNEVVLGPTSVRVTAGKIQTWWIGGQVSSGKLDIYTVNHN